MLVFDIIECCYGLRPVCFKTIKHTDGLGAERQMCARIKFPVAAAFKCLLSSFIGTIFFLVNSMFHVMFFPSEIERHTQRKTTLCCIVLLGVVGPVQEDGGILVNHVVYFPLCKMARSSNTNSVKQSQPIAREFKFVEKNTKQMKHIDVDQQFRDQKTTFEPSTKGSNHFIFLRC